MRTTPVPRTSVRLDWLFKTSDTSSEGMRTFWLKLYAPVVRRDVFCSAVTPATQTILATRPLTKEWMLSGKERLSSMLHPGLLPCRHYAWSTWGHR